MDRAYSKFEVKTADADTGEITGIATTVSTDRQGDVVVPSGAEFSLPLPLLFAHDHREPVGSVTQATVTNSGIEIIAKLALDAGERVREILALIKSHALRGLSIGFQPLASEPIAGGGTRFTRWSWLELSLVSVPANAEATITAIKSAAARPASPALHITRIHPVKESRWGQPVRITDSITALEGVSTAAFIGWLTRAQAEARRRGCTIESAADALGAPPEMAMKIRSAAESTLTQPGLAGSSREIVAFVQQAGESSLLLRMIADRATAPIPLRCRVMVPDGDPVAQVVGEGAPIPISGFSLNTFEVEPFKIAAAICMTEELLSDVSPAAQGFLNGLLRGAVAKAADEALFARLTDSGTLTLTCEPEAFMNADLPASFMLSYREALSAVIGRATDRAYLGFGVKAAAFLSALPGLPEGCNPATGTFAGRPVVVTEAVAPWSIAIVNAGAFVGAADRVEFAASNAATVQTANPATNDATTPTGKQLVSLYQCGAMAVKIVLHLAIQAIRPNGLAFVGIMPESGW